MKKFRLKRPDGSFATTMYETPSLAVAAAADLIDVQWRDGCEAIAKLDSNMAWLVVLKCMKTGDMVGIDAVEVEDAITYQLSVEFHNELDRSRAEAILKQQFECTTYFSDKGQLGDLLEAEESRK